MNFEPQLLSQRGHKVHVLKKKANLNINNIFPCEDSICRRRVCDFNLKVSYLMDLVVFPGSRMYFNWRLKITRSLFSSHRSADLKAGMFFLNTCCLPQRHTQTAQNTWPQFLLTVCLTWSLSSHQECFTSCSTCPFCFQWVRWECLFPLFSSTTE